MKPLTEAERSRVVDGKHSIQAASDALAGVDRSKIPNIEAIEECLENADHTLRAALQNVEDQGRSRGRN